MKNGECVPSAPLFRVLVYGAGGREHCLAWKLAQCAEVDEIFCLPGNGGSDEGVFNKRRLGDGPRVSNCEASVPVGDFEAVAKFCRKQRVNLVVVGPEQPLCDGLKDALPPEVRVFGPSKAAAELEGSKAWSKDFMARHGIPTAKYRIFRGVQQVEAAKTYVDEEWRESGPVVVKASGLAAGKGVYVPETAEQAKQALNECLVKKLFGGEEVVVEERLEGVEASVLALCDGRTAVLLPPAQDHKRVYDGDKGPNTGGMGAFCPSQAVSGEVLSFVYDSVVQPTLDGMCAEGRSFMGCLFVGIMILPDSSVRVLEFNVRFGDPETQAVVPLLKQPDLLQLLVSCTDGTLNSHVERHGRVLSTGGQCAVSVVIASGGYPSSSYQKGFAISGLDDVPNDIMVFHAGTTWKNGKHFSSGGRVLCVTAVASDLPTAREKAYAAAALIHFEGSFYRTDIGSTASLEANALLSKS